jgi:6-phosphogluconolactonase/glucosamine-6-phosphate isomerase/deaminase
MEMILAEPASGVAQLTERLNEALESSESVAWLVPGGSNIPLAVEAMTGISDESSRKLTILLTDERYGEVGHKDSNYKQLIDAGFAHKQARFIPTLMPGSTLEEVTIRYAAVAREALQSADEVIAQFGIGNDGHIAGILPFSDAAKSSDYAASYQTETFTRVTLTFDALRHIDTAFAFVYGADKRAALQKLHERDVPLIEQPSQILKELTESYVYNDQIGEQS